MRNCQPGAYYAGAGRWVAEVDLRHVSVSDHPTTDIRETCTIEIVKELVQLEDIGIILKITLIFNFFEVCKKAWNGIYRYQKYIIDECVYQISR